MKKLLTLDNKSVKISKKSHLHICIKKQWDILLEAVKTIDTENKDCLVVNVKFNRLVGLCNVVATTKQDVIVYKRRKNRKHLSRFVLDRAGEPSNRLTIILRKVKNGYEIITVYFGYLTPAEPKTKKGYLRDKFWKKHAFVLENK